MRSPAFCILSACVGPAATVDWRRTVAFLFFYKPKYTSPPFIHALLSQRMLMCMCDELLIVRWLQSESLCECKTRPTLLQDSLATGMKEISKEARFPCFLLLEIACEEAHSPTAAAHAQKAKQHYDGALLHAAQCDEGPRPGRALQPRVLRLGSQVRARFSSFLCCHTWIPLQQPSRTHLCMHLSLSFLFSVCDAAMMR